MSKRRIHILLSLSVAVMLFAACKKNMSSDQPLPTSYYPSVIISSDNQVIYAVDPTTGKKNWEFNMPNNPGTGATAFRPSPLIYGGMVYMASIYSDTIYKINSKTGALVKKVFLQWHNADNSNTPFPAGHFAVVATPIADGNLIYLATTNDSLYAFDTSTGVVKWAYGGAGPLVSSPTIYNGNVFGATTNGHVFCVNKTTGPDASGIPIWDYPGPGAPPVSIFPSIVPPSFTSSPCISAPYLYIGSSSDSNMYCIYLTPPNAALVSTATNILKWTFKTGGAINSSPTASGGVCIFGSNDFYVYCVDSQLIGTSTIPFQRWKFHTTSQINSSPIIDNQTVYVGSYDYFLYSLSIIDGSRKWSFKSTGLLKSSPLPYEGSIFIASYDGSLYAVDSGAGTLKWKYPVNGNVECSPAIDDFSGKQYNSGISGFTN